MTRARHFWLLTTLLALASAASPGAQQSPATPTAPAAVVAAPALPHELGIKYVRDSEEYAALARQVYRVAGDTVARVAPGLKGRPWAVVLDVDETALDNSTYQLERAAYGLPFEAASWSAWVRRREAPAVPGAAAFVTGVRKAGGRVAWITNRTLLEADATRENLRTAGLWSDDDRMCAQRDAQHTKRSRRGEVRSGSGACAWTGTAMSIVAFVGDQMGDFPDADEEPRDTAGDNTLGRSSFLLPNPMYGGWTTRVTRLPK